MAKDKTTEKVSGAQAAVTGQKFDMSKFMPQGMDEKELVELGGLNPICAAEITSQGSPVAGWLIAELEMPPRLSIEPTKRKAGVKEPWSAFLILLTAGTKGGIGDEIVDVPAGKKVLVPVGGNLGNNDELRLAAADVKKCYWVFLNCTGAIPMSDGRNDMWNYEVSLHPAGVAREGDYRAPLPKRKAIAALPNGDAGKVIDATGKAVESVVGGA